ncbi:hypothetical protein F8388_007169 [Cannabis sativa]|uniref:Uncharacterized protein n=1 Tax=Cannabis sativa TaxID=3483 RepID=A0A7J6GJ14_CANSA|nr:hypothetical protein F8388_007169 [Cannabis sativa]KAF4382838.1 hypothetical protein G4B88_021621 [Cannabis sativa]
MKFFLKKSPHTQKIYEKMMSKFNAASALVNSFDSLASSAPTLLVFIILVTNDQLLLDFGPEMNESNDSKTVTAIDSTSLNMLTVSLLTCSFLRELKVVLFSKALRNEASVEDLNMPSNSEMRGCCLEGKLLDRTQKSHKGDRRNLILFIHNKNNTLLDMPHPNGQLNLQTRGSDHQFSENKANKDSNVARVTASTSLRSIHKFLNPHLLVTLGEGLLSEGFALNINMNRADDVTKFASSTSFAFSTNGVDCALALRLYVSRH